MSTGERIKKARKTAGLTQKQLAAKLGTSQQNIAQYESGKRNPKQETLREIADILNVSIEDLKDTIVWPQEIYFWYKKALEDQQRQNQLATEKVINDTIEEWTQIYSEVMEKKYGSLLTLYDSLNDAGKEYAIRLLQTVSDYPLFQKQSEPGEDKPEEES
ncbi:MAG: helix-turn-helix domain-containing protein [Clostridiales bacterium]|nr:helix-turn-helix domain-containing protein [Clostridiales bacterium]